MNLKMTDITALGRPIDPSYPTNRAIVLLSVATVLVGGIARLAGGMSLLPSIGWGVGAGLSVFLGWALARELDPDHDLSAFVGAGLTLIGLLLLGLPSLLVLFWLLLALRIVNRTAGLPARPLDSLAILGLGGWLAWQGNWLTGFVTAIALLLDGLLSSPLRYHLLLSGVAFAATAALFALQGDFVPASDLTMPAVLVAALLAALFVVVIANSRELSTEGDVAGEPLNPKRVQAAQFIALFTALLYAWWDGEPGVLDLLPLWAAMAGVALYRLTILFRPRIR
jgi:hypothetical protein